MSERITDENIKKKNHTQKCRMELEKESTGQNTEERERWPGMKRQAKLLGQIHRRMEAINKYNSSVRIYQKIHPMLSEQ